MRQTTDPFTSPQPVLRSLLLLTCTRVVVCVQHIAVPARPTVHITQVCLIITPSQPAMMCCAKKLMSLCVTEVCVVRALESFPKC